MPRERRDDEWREVQDQRYNEGFYPQSGKIHPFFRKLGRPSRRFGIQLLVLGAASAVVGATGIVGRGYAVFFFVFAAVLLLGAVGHLRRG